MSRCLKIVVAVAMLSMLAAACSSQGDWRLKNITGLMPPLQFTLTNDDGKVVNADAYRGKVVLLYFGYTHCPDICPATLQSLAAAIHSLGSRAQQVRVLFVTVDPARDSVAVMHDYTGAFGPEFVGLRGDQDQLHLLTKRYRVTYGLGKPDADGNYEVSHSSAVFVFDEQGKVRLLAQRTDSPKALAHDLRRLIDESPA
jgi:protein SCO1/2